MKPPPDAMPGPPSVCWSPTQTGTSENPWRPGVMVWHPVQKVWYRLVCESAYGVRAPHDSILLTPEHPTNGTPDLAARLDNLEQLIRQRLGWMP